MDLNIAKTICIISLFLSTWLFTCVPYFLTTVGLSKPRHVLVRDAIISHLKCLAGGVFMSVCFIDLIPEGMHAMEEYFLKTGIDTDFPAFMCVAALGFFMISAVELIAHSLLEGSRKSHHNCNSHIHDQQNGDVKDTSLTIQKPAVDSCGKTAVSHTSNGSHSNGHINHGDKKQEVFEMKEMCHKHNHKDNNPILIPNEETAIRESVGQMVEVNHNHEDVTAVLSDINAAPLRAFLLLAAFSFHTVFDGLAIGLCTTEGGVWQMFTAVAIHKSLVSICLGLQLFLQFKNRPMRGVLWSLFFAIISPIGLGIGMALTSRDIDETANLLTNIVLQGMATGTFLFVIFFEILREDMVEKKGFKRLFMVVLGFTVMALVLYFWAG